jgi:hypothetical protein
MATFTVDFVPVLRIPNRPRSRLVDRRSKTEADREDGRKKGRQGSKRREFRWYHRETAEDETSELVRQQIL